MTGTLRVQEQHQDDCPWILKSPEATGVVILQIGEITDHVHSRDNFFQRVPSGIVLNVHSVATVCQCGYHLHKTAMPSQINAFNQYTMHMTCSLWTQVLILWDTES